MRHALFFSIGLAVLFVVGGSAPGWAPLTWRKPGVSVWPASRNMVNLHAKGLPTEWCVDEGKHKNVKWVADIGRRTFSTPVVANGMVFVGARREKEDRAAVLLAFRESDGKLVWAHRHSAWWNPREESSVENNGPYGLASTPTVAERRIYYVTPSCEVICADTADGKVAWKYDMVKELGVVPGEPMAPFCVVLSNTTSPLIVGDLVYVCSGHGRDESLDLKNAGAPSFVALNKATGKLKWSSNLPGENILDAPRSSPTYADVDGRPQVIFPGGDGVIYSFHPLTGELLWKCDCLPTRQPTQIGRRMDYHFHANPVVVKDRLYIGMGMNPDAHLRGHESYFLCLDITKKGDVSFKSYDAKANENKNSALVWAYGGPMNTKERKSPHFVFGSTVSTAAVHDGLVYITQEVGYMHCLDAGTGQLAWRHDFQENIWGSPYWADGRIFVCTLGGQVKLFAHGRKEKVLSTIDMDTLMHCSPVAANGTLYIATDRKLYAISSR